MLFEVLCCMARAADIFMPPILAVFAAQEKELLGVLICQKKLNFATFAI
jgi:hypothetical protein